MTSKPWSSTTKTIVIALLVVFGIALLITFRAMIRPTIIAVLISFILYQPVNWVQQQTVWSRGVSIVTVYLILVLLLMAAPAIFIPRLGDSVDSLSSVLQTLVVDLQTASRAPTLTFGGYTINANTLFQQLGDILQNILSPAAAGAWDFALTLTTTAISAVYVVVLSFWMLKDSHKLQRGLLQALPVDYREDIRRLGQELVVIWHAFLRGQFALGFVVGVITWVAMSIVGLPNAAGLALLAGLMEFLPTIGPGVSGALGTLVALFQGSTWMQVDNGIFALIVLGIYVIITQIESVYLIPRLVGRRVHLHPAVTFAGIISAAVVFGVLGVLLITPTIASFRVLLTYILRKLRDQEPFSPTYLQSEVRIPGLIGGHRIAAIVFDLDGTLTRLDLGFAEAMAARLHRLDRLWGLAQRRYFFRRLMSLLDGPIDRGLALLNWMQLYEDIRRLMPTFNKVRGFPPASELSLRPGLGELLTHLSYSYQLALLTVRSCEEVEQFFQQSGLQPGCFSVVISAYYKQGAGSPSDGLRQAIAELQVEPDQLLVVSDSGSQLRAAQALGAVSAGVLCGFGDDRSFAEADLVLADPTELDKWL